MDCLGKAVSSANNFSIDFQNGNLVDALYIIAKVMHKNIIVSHAVSGSVSLHVHKVSAQKTYDMLLTSHDLIMVSLGGVSLVTSRQDWLQRKQEQLKLQESADAVAPLITRVWQLHYAKAEDVARLLSDSASSLLSKRGHVRVDARTNIICLQDTEEHLQQIEYLLKRVDIPVQQVLIEAHLASVDSDFERELGIHFAVTNSSVTESQGAIFSKTRYGLLVAKLTDGNLLDMQLSALENAGHGELISSPRLFTANQQLAEIEAGEEIPYHEESPSGGTATVFKKAVLSLKVTPQILPGKKVLLSLQINQDKPSKLLVQGVPAINTRQISTNVLIQDGETIVLGGIYESNQETSKQSIPFLGKIPLVGLLFQQNDTIDNKRELLIFVTPRIVPQGDGIRDGEVKSK